MKITDIKVNQLKAPEGRDGKKYPDYAAKVIIQVYTDEGLVGISEGVRNVSVFRAYVEDLIKPLIVGMDPRQPRQIWEILALGVGQRATRFPSQIVGAIDVACWDITGKAAGLPLYTLFGGAKRMTIPLYWSRGNGWKKEPSEMLEEVQEGFERGFRAFKVRMDWKEYRQDVNPAKDLAIFQKCREWLPDDVYLAFDANNGDVLWSFNAGSGFRGGPVSYSAGGEQYVAVPSGLGSLVMGLYPHLWPETADFPAGAAMIAFKVK